MSLTVKELRDTLDGLSDDCRVMLSVENDGVTYETSGIASNSYTIKGQQIFKIFGVME